MDTRKILLVLVILTVLLMVVAGLRGSVWEENTRTPRRPQSSCARKNSSRSDLYPQDAVRTPYDLAFRACMNGCFPSPAVILDGGFPPTTEEKRCLESCHNIALESTPAANSVVSKNVDPITREIFPPTREGYSPFDRSTPSHKNTTYRTSDYPGRFCFYY